VLSGGRGRLLTRCIGACNVQTDIKEAVFVGQDDALVAAGSDDGYVFIFDAVTGVRGCGLWGGVCCVESVMWHPRVWWVDGSRLQRCRKPTTHVHATSHSHVHATSHSHHKCVLRARHAWTQPCRTSTDHHALHPSPSHTHTITPV
jgi:hypothetical protein